jgi:hypothetical protein
MWPKNSSSRYCDRTDFQGRTVAAATAYLDRMHTLKGKNHKGTTQAQQDVSQALSQSGPTPRPSRKLRQLSNISQAASSTAGDSQKRDSDTAVTAEQQQGASSGNSTESSNS